MGPEERIPQDWFPRRWRSPTAPTATSTHSATRIAHIRTWTFVSNRVDWLAEPELWQDRSRAIEASLSDALHVPAHATLRRPAPSALMKG